MRSLLNSRAFWQGGARYGWRWSMRYLFIPWVVLMVAILAWKALA